jgi:alanyl-tRNA synthetase
LGDGVDQKGSLVAPEKLRFDFSCKSGATVEQLRKIEEICNDFIRRDLPVYAEEVPLHVAKAIHGLRAVFGEVSYLQTGKEMKLIMYMYRFILIQYVWYRLVMMSRH